MIQVYKIDENGFYTGIEEVEELDEFCITEPITIGYVKPKWNGAEWIEGATEEEIAEWKEKNKPQPSTPTEQDKINANLMLEIAKLKAKVGAV